MSMSLNGDGKLAGEPARDAADDISHKAHEVAE